MPQKAKDGSKSPYKFVRSEISELSLQYNIIRDCINGEPAIKGMIGTNSPNDPSLNNGGAGLSVKTRINVVKAQRYLPMPNADDQSPANKKRYLAYVERAVYYNVTARTLEGMVGQIYLVPPVMELPSKLEQAMTNADGQGLDLTQLSKRGVRNCVAYGRAGLFIDYPEAPEGGTKIADLESGDIQPVIKVYSPWNVINWRTKKRGAKTILTLVVLREYIDDEGDDGFTLEPYEQYRVLKLEENEKGKDVYTMCVYGPDAETGEEEITPKDSEGNTFDSIPFTFVGSENNDVAVDKPPIWDLASLNLGHYRNSADYEESSHQVGQPTPVISGVDQGWLDNVLKGSVPLGSRASIALPPNAKAELLQASPNQIPLEAMKHKEDQMMSIGAKLVIQKRVQRTATESLVDASSESSVLTNVANNVSSAFLFALQFAARFLGEDTKNIKFALNTEFELNQMTADDQAKLIASWQKGAISFTEMRHALRKSGTATIDDAKAKAEIIADQEQTMSWLTPPIAEGAAGTDTGPAPDPKNNAKGHAANPKAAGR